MQTETQRVAPGMVVSIAYTLTVDHEQIASADASEPLQYLHGAQEILPGLENALEGRHVGDKFSITLPPDQAYGDYDEDNIEEIDREDMPDADEFEVGMVVDVEDEDGYNYLAHIREITDDTIVLDFNPPLAGKTLHYDVEVLAVRPATDDEIAHGHAHGPHSHDDADDEDDEF
ncbi:MAG: peptidylprolyl isomerase [Anaerolinea sp.]|nr:peptidylprolyl isomerase [Anaerolinea sp.]